MIRIKFIVVALVLLVCSRLLGQDSYVVEQINTKQGLSQDFVNAALQDSSGFIWMGTGAGLNRYDGQHIAVFDSSNTNINDHYISSLCITSDKQLMYGTKGGNIGRYNYFNFQNLGIDSLKIQDKVTAILEIGSGDFIIGYDKRGVHRVNVAKGSWTQLMDFINVHQLIFNGADVFIRSKDAILTFNINSNSLDTIIEMRATNMLYSESNQTLIVHSRNKLTIWNKDRNNIKEIDLPLGVKNSCLKNDNEIALLQNVGISILDIANGIVTKEILFETKISGKIEQFFKDTEGNYWLTVYGKGAYLIKKVVFKELKICNGLNVTSIASKTNGEIYLGTTNGLFKMNQNNELNRVNSVDTNIHITQLLARDNELWIASKHNGVLMLKNEIQVNLPALSDYNDVEITDFAVRDSQLVVSTIGHGILILKSDLSVVEVLNTRKGLTHNNIKSVFVDSNRDIWLATPQGKISRLTPTNKLEFVELKNKNFMFNINCFAQKKSGEILVGTESEGILQIEERNLLHNNFKEDHSMSIVNSIDVVNSQVWISFTNGIALLNDSLELYLSSKKMLKNELIINPNATCVYNNKVLVGHQDGVVEVSGDILASIKGFRYVVEELKVNGHPVDYRDYAYSSNKNSIELRVQAISMLFGNNVSYQFMLKEDKQTFVSEVLSEGKVFYPGLSFGDYTIFMRTRVGNANWSIWKNIYQFDIPKPFYLQLWFILLLVVLSGITPFVYFRVKLQKELKAKKELKRIITERTKEIVEQKELIEEKNKEIIESVEYAEGIQFSMIPDETIIKSAFEDAFVLFKPKDIVSGDFYFYEEFNGLKYVACADCTGHGVPGALVSVICIKSLSRAIQDMKLTDPGDILNATRDMVKESFKQNPKGRKDGMDITLCCIDEENRKLIVAGAYNPLFVISQIHEAEAVDENVMSLNGNKLEIIAVDKQPVASYEGETAFKSTVIDLVDNQSFYMSTDGFPDQFGGPKGKKYMIKNFKKTLLRIQSNSFFDQKKMLIHEYDSWMGKEEQIDDVTVIGFRVNLKDT